VRHPEELLADYVDGTLDKAQRAVVADHLSGCASCREEVELARAAVAAVARLDEVRVPFGATGPVLAEAGRRLDARRIAWRRLSWATGLAAAASLVLVVALSLGGGQEPATVERASAGAATGAAPAADTASRPAGFLGVERQPGVTYDDAGIASLARGAAELVQGADRASEGATGQHAFTSPDRALACVARSGGPTEDGTLVRLIEAEFEGTPAYIAVFAEGPGAGQAEDTIVVWVASKQGCTFLAGASQRI
jgi:anti-sigma factor RsiW